MTKNEILDLLERMIMAPRRVLYESAATYGRTVDEQVQCVAESVVYEMLGRILDTIGDMR